jgi:branched-chain amino acid transport system ATP-binding protein
MLLEVKDLRVQFGKATALAGVSLQVEAGEIVAIVGANGAGKTTIMRSISGLKRSAGGQIWFDGKRIDRLPAHEIVKRGIVQVPAGRMIFAPMTVHDNLKMGACLRKDRKAVREDLDEIYEHFPRLKERLKQLGGSLSGGEQQMLAIARALMAKPRLLLLDEPTIGLSPILVQEVGHIIQDINARGIGILLVEQNCRVALKLAGRAYALELGTVALAGPCQDLANDERVQACYLGGL